jgi:hypothetical protein
MHILKTKYFYIARQLYHLIFPIKTFQVINFTAFLDYCDNMRAEIKLGRNLEFFLYFIEAKMPKQENFDSGQAKNQSYNLKKGHPFLPKRSFLAYALSLRPQPTSKI